MAQALTKKFKLSDGHAVPVQCDSPNSNAGAPAHDPSERLECDVNSLTDGSDGSSREDTAQRNGGADCTQASGTTVAPANFLGYAGTGCGKIEGGATCVAYAGAGLPFDDLVLEKLELSQVAKQGGMISNKIEAELSLGNCTKNIPDASDHGNANANVLLNCNNHENSNSENKLHNLLESSSRTISAR